MGRSKDPRIAKQGAIFIEEKSLILITNRRNNHCMMAIMPMFSRIKLSSESPWKKEYVVDSYILWPPLVLHRAIGIGAMTNSFPSKSFGTTFFVKHIVVAPREFYRYSLLTVLDISRRRDNSDRPVPSEWFHTAAPVPFVESEIFRVSRLFGG